MNVRHREIGEFFSFLQDNGKNKNKFEEIFETLESEINKEQSVEPDIDKNEYLNALLQIHTSAIDHFEKSKANKPQKISSADFNKFMNDLMQDVSLHGLGAVEWEPGDW